MKNKYTSLVLEIGQVIYEKAKYGIFFAPVGFVVLLLTMLFCGEYAAEYAIMSGHYDTVNGIVGFTYLLIFTGIIDLFVYFMGLILIALGITAKNTEEIRIKIMSDPGAAERVRENSTSSEKPADKAPVKKATPVFTPPSNWTCTCGRVNASYVSTCNCGVNKREVVK